MTFSEVVLPQRRAKETADICFIDSATKKKKMNSRKTNDIALSLSFQLGVPPKLDPTGLKFRWTPTSSSGTLDSHVTHKPSVARCGFENEIFSLSVKARVPEST